MYNKLIPHNRPSLTLNDSKYVSNIFKSNILVNGSNIQKFEDEFCNYIGLPNGHAIAVSSGTSALYLSLWALNLSKKTIAIPAYSCTALRNAVKMNNSKIAYVDNEIDSPNLDINELNLLNTDGCIVPHMFGIPIDILKIKYKVIIEDCCQSLGALYNGKKLGLFGDVGVFSFYATKLITSGGHGGMIISKNKTNIEKIRDYIAFDMKNDKINRFNFQITELQAAVGRSQLKKLDKFLLRREEIFKMYEEAGLNLQKSKSKNAKQVYYRAVMKTNDANFLIKSLNESNIRAINPVTKDELLAKKKNCIKYCSTSVSLPIYPSLTNNEVKKIINIIKQVIN